MGDIYGPSEAPRVPDEIPEYSVSYIPACYTYQFENADELLYYESVTKKDDVIAHLKSMIGDVPEEPGTITLSKCFAEKEEDCKSLDDYLKKKGLFEAEQYVIKLYAMENSVLRNANKVKGSFTKNPFEHGKKPLNDDELCVFAVMISALRKLRVFISDYCGFPQVNITDSPKGVITFEEKRYKIKPSAYCTLGFLNAEMIENDGSGLPDMKKVKTRVVPNRGMISVIPCNPPILVFEPGTILYPVLSDLYEEAPWNPKVIERWGGERQITNKVKLKDKNIPYVFPDQLRSEWLFPVHHVFQRGEAKITPSDEEKTEAEGHVQK